MGDVISAKARNMELVYDAIKAWFASGKDYNPGYRDLVEATGLSIGTVHKTTQFLRSEGLITFHEGLARSIQLSKEATS